jgi:hypothetical protein
MRDAGLQGIQAIVSGSSVYLRKAPSSTEVKTVERTSFGPIGASLAKERFFHLATVFGLIPYCSAKSFRLFLTMLYCSTHCLRRAGAST